MGKAVKESSSFIRELPDCGFYRSEFASLVWPTGFFFTRGQTNNTPVEKIAEQDKNASINLHYNPIKCRRSESLVVVDRSPSSELEQWRRNESRNTGNQYFQIASDYVNLLLSILVIYSVFEFSIFFFFFCYLRKGNNWGNRMFLSLL